MNALMTPPPHPRSALSHLECTACGTLFPASVLIGTCQQCGKVLAARYDLASAARELTPAMLAGRDWTIWRYAEVLPVLDPRFRLSLGEGGTPLREASWLGRYAGLDRLLLKDEGCNPTGSFKARGLCAAVARAWELGARVVALPSAGNAGVAAAAYAARAGLPAVVAMPRDTPEPLKAACQGFGAVVLLVDGLIDDCGRVIRAGAATRGWFDLSTLREPYRVEGKKTMGFELAEQLGWRLPDAIIFPTGGGTGIAGMWKAFAEMEAMGLITAKRPRMIIVQAEGCAPLARAYREGLNHATRWENAQTGAAGLHVPAAIGDYLILAAIRASGGTAVTVSKAEILEGMHLAAKGEGMLISPESGAAVAAAIKLRASGALAADEETVVFCTGSGLTHTNLFAADETVLPRPTSDEEARAIVQTLPELPPFDA